MVIDTCVKSVWMDHIANLGGEIPYSEDDMRRLCSGKVHVLSYKEAVGLGSIDRVLGSHGAAIVLCETEPNYGHWIALIDAGDGVLEWFDSYGMAPDEESKMVPASFRAQSKQDAPHLTNMIEAGGYKRVIYNPIALQAKRGSVSTCGRWCAFRVLMREFPLQKFIGLFMGQRLKPDQYVTLVTLFNA